MQLLKKGIRTYSARKTQFLSKIAMKRRFEWCKMYREYDEDYWRNVLFSEEIIIEINPQSLINKIRQGSFENPQNVSLKFKFSLKVMFRSGIFGNGNTNLMHCNKIMNSRV